MNYAGYIVGGVVIFYAAEEFIAGAMAKKLFRGNGSLFEDFVQMIIGVLLILTSPDIVKVCIIWGIWSIIRESREMSEAIKRILNKRPGIINVAESIVVIFMSASMVLEPGLHHATVHMFLLGIELILEIVFEAAEIFYEKKLERRADKLASGEKLEAQLEERVQDEARSA